MEWKEALSKRYLVVGDASCLWPDAGLMLPDRASPDVISRSGSYDPPLKLLGVASIGSGSDASLAS